VSELHDRVFRRGLTDSENPFDRWRHKKGLPFDEFPRATIDAGKAGENLAGHNPKESILIVDNDRSVSFEASNSGNEAFVL
jgi:hypothetical protein